MSLPPIKIIASLGMEKGRAFAYGWYEGIQRYKGITGELMPGSDYDPAKETTEYAASEAALAYCVALEKAR